MLLFAFTLGWFTLGLRDLCCWNLMLWSFNYACVVIIVCLLFALFGLVVFVGLLVGLRCVLLVWNDSFEFVFWFGVLFICIY